MRPDYDQFLADPQAEDPPLCAFCDVDGEFELPDSLAVTAHARFTRAREVARKRIELDPFWETIAASRWRPRVLAEPPHIRPVRTTPSTDRPAGKSPARARIGAGTVPDTAVDATR